MPEYRAYILTNDRQIIDQHVYSAADDKTARAHAKQYVDGHDIEIWQLERWVGHLRRLTDHNVSGPSIEDVREE